VSLVDDIKSVLDAYGLGELAQWIVDQEVAGKDDLTILTEMRQTSQYKARFPAMDALRKAQAAGTGVAVTEAQYLSMESAYRQAFASSGLPREMYDDALDFKALLEANVSPAEVQRRIAAARTAVDSTDLNTRRMMRAIYGITTEDLMAYALQPDKMADRLQKIAATSILAGYGRTAGLADLWRGWEPYAQDLLNQGAGDEDFRSAISDARTLVAKQHRLAEIDNEKFTTTDALDIAIRKDPNKVLASQKRAERERARFSGGTGIRTGTFAKDGI